MDTASAVRQVLREALHADGLARGIDESAKALDQRRAKMCFLAKDCEEAAYTNLVEALCKEQECPLVKVDDKKVLGEMAGLCKIDKDGNARKMVQCSSVVILNFGKETQARDFLLGQDNIIE